MDLNVHKFHGDNATVVFGVADYSRELNRRDLEKRRQKGEPDIEFVVRKVDAGIDPDRVAGILVYRGASFAAALTAAGRFADISNLPVWLRRYKG